MKRTIAISLFFVICLGLVFSTGCRLGPEECECRGLCDNKVINNPCGACYDESCSGRSYEDISKEDFKTIAYIYENSGGNGKNGYITVYYQVSGSYDSITKKYGFLGYYENVRLFIEIYDADTLVGKETVGIELTRETDGWGTEGYVNVEIPQYIYGDFSCAITEITGKLVLETES